VEDINKFTAEFRLKSQLEDINQLSSHLEQISGKFSLNKNDFHDVHLVLEEWFTNLILHGSEGRGKKEIVVQVHVTEEKVILIVTDEGKYFNPKEFTLPDLNQPLEKRVPGGIGLHLIFKLMDKIAYKRENDRNVLRLEKFRSID
jgi:serine/threonine-protein kinase RsbW